jgi:hypothetical protein
MAKIQLIECLACGKNISFAATSCPACGHPLAIEKKEVDDEKNVNYEEVVTKQEKRKKGIGCSIIIMFIGFLVIYGIISGGKNKDNTSNIKQKAEASADSFAFNESEFIGDLSRALQEKATGVTMKRMTSEERNALGLKDSTRSLYMISAGPQNGVMLMLTQDEHKKITYIHLARGIGDNFAFLPTVAVYVGARIAVLQGKELREDKVEQFSSYLIDVNRSPKEEKWFHCSSFITLYKFTDGLGAFMFSPR